MSDKAGEQSTVAAGAGDDEPGTVSWLLALVVFSVQATVYILTLFPSVPGGDSGELIAVSNVMGVAHPPGYPTFTLVNKAFITLVPWGSVAWRANLLSALCASAAGTLLYAITVRLGGMHSSGVAVLGLFSFTRLTWMYSVTAEVFSMNNLMVCVVLYVFVEFWLDPSPRRAAWGAFWSGLALTNQHTSVLFLVVIVPSVLLRAPELLTTKRCATMGLAGLLGLVPYLWLPLCAHMRTAGLTWGDQRTLDGMLKHFLRQEYGTFDLANRDQEETTFLTNLRAEGVGLMEETFNLALPLALVGMAVPLRSRVANSAKWPLAMALLFYVWFFNWRANLPLDNPLLAGVHERFWMQPNLVVAIFACLGLTALLRLIPRGLRGPLGWVFAAALVGAQLGQNYHMRDESNNTAVRDAGNALLNGLPQNSILLVLGDLPGNAARYVQWCDGVRPDVRIIDLEMATYDWYIPMVGHSFKGVTFPGKQKVYRFGPQYFTMKTFFDANIDKFDIFVFQHLNEQDETWQAEYETRHYGMAWKIVRRGSPIDLQHWLVAAGKAVPDFPLPDPIKYDERTWEHVVRQGYLAAGVNLAMFFEGLGKQAASEGDKEAFLRAANKVYSDLFAREQGRIDIPPYWHKNHGVVCSALYPITSETKFLRCIVDNWQRYLDSGADDPQMPDIKRAVQGYRMQL